jgi:hypothetical protein
MTHSKERKEERKKERKIREIKKCGIALGLIEESNDRDLFCLARERRNQANQVDT